jgi:ribose transport system ATP-binding protein
MSAQPDHGRSADVPGAKTGEDRTLPGVVVEPLVELKGITKSFGAVKALRGVDFELRPGEVHALLGQNGAGKSTLIKILSGVNTKDDGVMRVCGEDVVFRSPADSRAAGVAVVYQELSLVPGMSIAANLYLGREPSNAFGIVRGREIIRDSRRFLTEHQLPLDPNALVATLPFAYRQLTEIAKALSGEVKVLVLDEPTSSLSGGEEEILFNAIQQVTSRGVGVIYVTHRLREVFRISDRVTVYRDGANAATFATRDTDMRSLVAAIVGPGHQKTQAATLAAETADQPPRAVRDEPSPSAVPVVELREVHNDRLRGVSLAVRPREIVGIAGVIGSGRTEILETVFGLRKVVSGELRVGGERVRLRRPEDAIRRGIALAPEDRHEQGLVLEHSIERNVAMPRLPQLSRRGIFRRKASRSRAGEAIRELDVKAPGPATPLRNLSGGNQQKVVFGKWRDPAPVLLLLDEPTVGVDVGAREELYDVVRRTADAGSAVLVVSSDLDELLLLCHRIIVVMDGRVVKEVHRSQVRNEEHLHHLVQEG